MSVEGEHDEWIDALRVLPGVVEVLLEDDHIVAVVATRERGQQVRASADDLGVPRNALRIRVMRHWLYPYPGDSEMNEQLLRQQMSEWDKEDEDL